MNSLNVLNCELPPDLVYAHVSIVYVNPQFQKTSQSIKSIWFDRRLLRLRAHWL